MRTASRLLGQNQEVSTLYVRNMPEALLRRARSTAVDKGESFRAFLVRAIRSELEREGVEVPEDDE